MQIHKNEIDAGFIGRIKLDGFLSVVGYNRSYTCLLQDPLCDQLICFIIFRQQNTVAFAERFRSRLIFL